MKYACGALVERRQENRKYSKKNLSLSHFSLYKSHIILSSLWTSFICIRVVSIEDGNELSASIQCAKFNKGY